MAGLCEDCDGCCRVFEVKEVNKAYGVPCNHLTKHSEFGGVGCGIYANRPVACQHYVCVWLDSQRRIEVERMPPELRPNVSHCVIGWPWGLDRETIHVYPYPEYKDAWRVGAVAEYLKMVLSRGGKVFVYTGDEGCIAMKGDMAVIGTEKEFAELLS